MSKVSQQNYKRWRDGQRMVKTMISLSVWEERGELWDDRYRTDQRIKDPRGISSGKDRVSKEDQDEEGRKCVKVHLEAPARLALKAHSGLILPGSVTQVLAQRCHWNCDLMLHLSEGATHQPTGLLTKMFSKYFWAVLWVFFSAFSYFDGTLVMLCCLQIRPTISNEAVFLRLIRDPVWRCADRHPAVGLLRAGHWTITVIRCTGSGVCTVRNPG